MFLRALSACLVLAMAGCDRAAPEPAVSSTPSPVEKGAAGSVSAGSAPASEHKSSCVRPLPKAPPPPPPYAVDPRCPRDPEGGPPMVPISHVIFPESKDAPRLELELMLSNKHQERGLMFRKSLADDKGMLFVWRQPAVHTFWMHNTCIPLDMLFIDQDDVVAGIVENAPTLNDEGRSVDCPVNYVLEVNAGWARKHGVLPGQKVKFDPVP